MVAAFSVGQHALSGEIVAEGIVAKVVGDLAKAQQEPARKHEGGVVRHGNANEIL